MMLVHIGQPDIAERIHNAWLRTLEDGIHTYESSKRASASRRWAPGVRPGRHRAPRSEAETSRPPNIPPPPPPIKLPEPSPRRRRKLVGVDVYVEWPSPNPKSLPRRSEGIRRRPQSEMISNRGVKVWPEGSPETCAPTISVAVSSPTRSRPNRSFAARPH